MLATLMALSSLIAATATEDHWNVGTLRFTRCELSQPRSATTTPAWCAPFDVPEDATQPDGRRITLRLAMIRSEAAVPAPDPVVLLAGGPGQAATESYPQVAGAFAPLRRHRHILLLDQRGTGGSNALDCGSGDADTAVATETDDSATAAAQARACLERVRAHADPRHYTTTAALADLEAVRRALGDVRLNLVGVSYGTRVAQHYLRAHPAGVRSIVLDGVVPNDTIIGADFAASLDAALRGRLALCAKDEACRTRFGDIHATLYETLARLERAALPTSIRDPQTFAELQRPASAATLGTLVRLYLYANETSALLPLAISEAAAGRAAPLVAQAQLVENELGASMTGGMALSVICSEDDERLKVATPDDTRILGSAFVRTLKAQCGSWPKGARPDAFFEPVTSDIPALLLSGEFDPVTPPSYGENVVRHYARGRHLVAPGHGHNVVGRGCLPKLVARFIETLDAAALDAGCISELGPAPFFLDYNGAAP
jgi:pimeloyl-ACP methyl ester carboxylesterase